MDERLFTVGAPPRPQKLIIDWPDLNAPTDNDRSNTAQKITDALVKYMTGNVFMLMEPREYLHIVLGYPLPQVEAVLAAVGAKLQVNLDKLIKMATSPPAAAPKAPGAAAPSKQKKLKKTKKVGVDEGTPA